MLVISKKLTLQPLTAQQVGRFIHIYLSDKAQAVTMQKQLQPRLKDFQETPLLLFMLCRVFKRYNRIPDNLGLAFREFAQLYDEEFKQGVERISYCRELLSYLAFKMMQGKEMLVPLLEVGEEDAIRWLSELTQVEDSYRWAQDWLTFLRKYHLLQRRRDKRIEFRHQLWQEYYAAEYLIDYLPQLSKEQVKANFLNLLKWTEALKLVQALSSSQVQVLQIAKLGLETDLRLGSALSGAVQDDFAVRCIEQLKAYPYPIQWLYIGWQILLRRLSNAGVVGSIRWAKPMLLLLLLKKAASSEATEYIASTLSNSSVSRVRKSAAEALGQIGDISAVEALRVALLTDGDAEVRVNAAEALGQTGDISAVGPLRAALRKDRDAEVRVSAAEALGQIGNASAVEPLRTALKDRDAEVASECRRSISQNW